MLSSVNFVFFFQAEDGIRDLVRSRGLGDVYKRQDEQSAYIPVWDVYMVLDDLETYSLAAMNDPTGLGLSLIHI